MLGLPIMGLFFPFKGHRRNEGTPGACNLQLLFSGTLLLEAMPEVDLAAHFVEASFLKLRADKWCVAAFI